MGIPGRMSATVERAMGTRQRYDTEAVRGPRVETRNGTGPMKRHMRQAWDRAWSIFTGRAATNMAADKWLALRHVHHLSCRDRWDVALGIRQHGPWRDEVR